MKPQQLLLLSALFFSIISCTPNHYIKYVKTANLSSISTLPHKKEVAVYFDKSEIKEDHVRIRILEASNGSYQGLINKLKIVGQKVGVDGILLLDKSNAEYTVGAEGDVYTASVNTLYGIGIKYKKNIDYLDRFVKKEHLFLVEDGGKKEVAVIQKSMSGDIYNKQDDENYYSKYVLATDLNYLRYDDYPTWFFQLGVNKQVASRILKNKNGLVAKRIKFSYDLNQRVDFIHANQLLGETSAVKISIDYVKFSTRVKEKSITEKRDRWKEVFIYNAQKKLIGKKLYKLIKGQEIPFLELEYEFYQNSDLEKILSASKDF